jgi:hypothetical protein
MKKFLLIIALIISGMGLNARNVTDVANNDLFVCWKVTDPDADEMKDMVSHWDEFVVLSAAGKPLGTAREYFLTK